MSKWGKENSDISNNITPKEWIIYFQHLLNDENANQLNTEGPMTFEPTLDRRIEVRELRKALQQLKRGKLQVQIKLLGNT